MVDHPALQQEIWAALGRRTADNYLRGHPGFQHLASDERVRWLRESRHCELAEGTQLTPARHERYALLLTGTVIADGSLHATPTLIDLSDAADLTAKTGVRLVVLPELREAASGSTG
jgi:hypothetical protein